MRSLERTAASLNDFTVFLWGYKWLINLQLWFWHCFIINTDRLVGFGGPFFLIALSNRTFLILIGYYISWINKFIVALVNFSLDTEYTFY